MPVIDHQERPSAETGIGQDARAAFACAARDVPPGTSWAFHDHRTMEDVIAVERSARRCRATTQRPRALGDIYGATSRNRPGPADLKRVRGQP